MKINADRDKIFRRKHDGQVMGSTIVLGVDYSTGVARADLADYYEQISNPTKQIVIETFVTEDELENIKPNFQEWAANEKVWAKDGDKPADIRRYKENLYKCVQSHTTQTDWQPDLTLALWNKFVPAEVIPAWKTYDGTPSTIHQVGGKVTHKGFTWISTAANNVWEPGVYGWRKV